MLPHASAPPPHLLCFMFQEWLAQQEGVKNEPLEIVYSYWDGSGHRRKVCRIGWVNTAGTALGVATAGMCVSALEPCGG